MPEEGREDPSRCARRPLCDVLRSCNEGNLRLVVLNACDTRSQAEALTEVVDCVVSMNRTITDRAAIKFAASFYGALAFGRSVQKAFEQGVARLSADVLTELGTPELLVRPGVDASRVVLVGSATGAGGGIAAQYFAAQREAIEAHVRRIRRPSCRVGGSRPIPGTGAERVLPHPRRSRPGQVGRRVSLDQVPGLAAPPDQPHGWPIGRTIGPPVTYSPARARDWIERTISRLGSGTG